MGVNMYLTGFLLWDTNYEMNRSLITEFLLQKGINFIDFPPKTMLTVSRNSKLNSKPRETTVEVTEVEDTV